MSLASRPAPRAVLIACAALAAGAALLAATEPAHAFKRGPMMRSTVAPAPRGAMTDVQYTLTVTDTETGRVRRPAMRWRNANTSDPGNMEVVVKVLDGRGMHTTRPGKFRVIQREPLR
jgi:hypothetical protein